MVLKFLIISLLVLSFSQCAIPKTETGGSAKTETGSLSRDIFGLRIGMNKADAEKHLKEIGKLSRSEEKNQQVWIITNNPSYGYLALGYDQADKIRYVTAFAKLDEAAKKVRFSEIGDLSKAKSENGSSVQRYVWDVPEANAVPAHQVILVGQQPEYLTTYSLKSSAANIDEDEEMEREGRSGRDEKDKPETERGEKKKERETESAREREREREKEVEKR